MGGGSSEFASTDPPAETPRRRRRTRIGPALALTPIVIALPTLGAAVMYQASDEPVDWNLVTAATIVAAAMCAVGWMGLVALRLAGRTNRRPRRHTGGHEVEDPELVRSLLARHDVACSACGYNLRGLATPSCPECREPVRLHLQGADPTRHLVWPARLAVAACALQGATGAFALYQIVPYWADLSQSMGPSALIYVYTAGPVACVLGALVVGWFGAVWLRAESTGARAHARWRVLRLAVWVFALLSVLDLCMWLARWVE